MNKILVRYGEIYLKGHNRSVFEKQLLRNIRKALAGYEVVVRAIPGRYLVEEYPDAQENKIVAKLKKVCGIYSISVAKVVSNAFEEICKAALNVSHNTGSFKIETKRADKSYPMNSLKVSAEVGAYILDNKPQLTVDLHAPDQQIDIEIREDGNAYLFADTIRGCGGLPVGCSGSGLLLLSGGIDSPVAGYMMAKRGMRLAGLHFHSYPYTSQAAKEKVVRLAKLLTDYCFHMRLHVVSFTEIQEAIHEKCPEQFMVIIMRRIMMRIANRICAEQELNCIVTGENLAQVASQTIESITVTNALAELPVLRPVIGWDKIDIIETARAIDTYETSIQPYEDCCTVFLPKRPVIKPKLADIEKAESLLDIEGLVERALSGHEMIDL